MATNGKNGKRPKAKRRPKASAKKVRPLTVKQRRFLAAYPLTGSVCDAAKAAGVHRCQHTRWLEAGDDSEYCEAFEDAKGEAVDRLVASAVERAVVGLRSYKFDKAGNPILWNGPDGTGPSMHYYEDKRSDVLTIFLLKALDPERFSEQVVGRHTHRIENVVAVFEPAKVPDGSRRVSSWDDLVAKRASGNGNGKGHG